MEPVAEEQPQVQEEEEQHEREQEQEAAQVEEEAGEETEQVEEQQQEVPEEEEEKYIPRLLDAAGIIGNNFRIFLVGGTSIYVSGNATPRSRDQSLEPESWTVKNLASFLEVSIRLKNLFLLSGFSS